MHKNKLTIYSIIFILTASFVAATPVLNIISPQATEYSATKILVNVTSTEPVDFFIKDPRGKRDTILATNTQELNDFLYVNHGEHEYTIWANNSNGEATAAVYYNSTVPNPVSVTDCGTLATSNTHYVLQNDILTSDRKCFKADEIRNITFDLNGYTVRGTWTGRGNLFQTWYSSDVEVFNGTFIGALSYSNETHIDYAPSYIIEPYGSKFYFHNLDIRGVVGANTQGARNLIFENVIINASIGFWHYSTSTHFINSTIFWNGFSLLNVWFPASGIFDQSDSSEIIIEQSTVSGFPDYDIYLTGTYTDYYLRDSNIDYDKIFYPDYTTDLRIFDQHLIQINLTNQFNETGYGIIELHDSNLFEVDGEINDKLRTLVNPTDDLATTTDDSGYAEVWVTEKLRYAKTSSPVVIEEFDFSTYEFIARTWENNATSTLNLTGVNSIIPFSMTIVVPQNLDECTVSQMLDLNNDQTVNVQDAIYILRHVAGLSVESIGPKQCEGISLGFS